MRTEIRFAGIGGQGSVLASTILAEAAGGLGGQEAVQTQFYEAAIRDGAAAGDIVLGDEPITFPWVLAPDYLVAQHQGALRAHLEVVKPGGVVIADTVYAPQIPETTATVYHVPLTEDRRRGRHTPRREHGRAGGAGEGLGGRRVRRSGGRRGGSITIRQRANQSGGAEARVRAWTWRRTASRRRSLPERS